MSYYETYLSLDIEKKVLPRDFINLLPKLSQLSTIIVERSDGTFVDGKFCAEQFIIWGKNFNTWLLPMIYTVAGEKRIKYMLIDDLVLSGLSSYEIMALKNMLNYGIYKSFIIANFHHISPRLTAIPTAPQLFNENKLYTDFTRVTPEFAPETALDLPEPLFI